MKSVLAVFALVAVFVTGACNRSPQEKADRFLKKGSDLMARKDYNRAVLEFKNAAQALPKEAEPVYRLGLAYLAIGNLNQAVAALFRATQLDPKHVGARVKVSELMARSGDARLIREGEKRSRELFESAPGNTDALNVLALSEVELGESEDAEAHLKEALQRLPNNLSSTVELAYLYLKRQDTGNAEEVLKKTQAAVPRSADAAIALAQFYVLVGRWPDAEAVFQSAVEVFPDEPRVLLGLAAVERRLGQKEQAEQTYRKLAALPDKGYQHLHAAYLFSEGRRDSAIEEFKLLAKKSADRATRNRLVAAYLVSGQVANAENVLEAALKTNPNDTDALLQHSQIRMRSGKDRDAENDLNGVLRFEPNSAQAHFLLAEIYGLRGSISRQNAELTDALRYNPALLPARVALAQLFVLSGSPKAALETLNSAPKEQQHSLTLLLERNLANYVGGDNAAFREGVAQALQMARTPDTLLQDAVVKFTEKDYAGERASIDEALRQSPDNIRALKAKVVSYTAQNQPKQAARFLSDYAAKSHSPAVAQFAGEWFWSQGERAQARNAWNQASGIDSQFVPAAVALAKADLAEERVDEARAKLTQVVSMDPRNISAQVLFAVLETRTGNFPGAIERYRKALELQPHNAQILNNLAYILADKADRPDEALAYAQEALEKAPGNPDAAGTLGWILYRKGIYGEAQRQLLRAAEEDGNSTQQNAVTRKYHLAMTCMKLGDKTRGMKILQEALQQNPNLPEAEMARSLVQ